MINNLSDLNEQLDLYFNHLNEENIVSVNDKILVFNVDQTTIDKFKKNIHYYYRWTEERDDKSLVKIVIDASNDKLNLFILEGMNKLINERVKLFYRNNKDYLVVIETTCNCNGNEILEIFNDLIIFCEQNKVACKIFHYDTNTRIQIFVNCYWVK